MSFRIIYSSAVQVYPYFPKIPLTCKSRLCPSCGFKYSATWTEKISNDIIKCPHRHALFTILKQYRKFFFYDKTLLSKLASAVNRIFKYQFHNIHHKNQRVSKIPKSSDHPLMLFIPLVETSSGILIFMLFSLLAGLIIFFTLLIFNIFSLNLLPINGNSLFLILFPMVNVLTVIFV